MVKYFAWYTLQLKAWVRRKTSWIQVLGMVLLALLLPQVHLPGAENTRVGVCAASDEYSQGVLECLKTRESIFDFIEYGSQEDMRQDIVSGVIECGFAFFEDDTVLYICTPFSAKGLVAQETFYAAFFEMYSEDILMDSAVEVYGKSNEEITRELLEKRQDYLHDHEMFQMDIIETRQKPTVEIASGNSRPVQGMVGLFIFVILWMAQGRKFENHGNGAAAALEIRQRWKFEYLGCLAEATVPAVLGIIFILFSAGHRGIGLEISSMLLFVFVSSLWVLAVGRLFKNSTTFAAWTLTLILVQLAVCPVFVDVSSYIPAIKVIRRVFPLGWLGTVGK